MSFKRALYLFTGCSNTANIQNCVHPPQTAHGKRLIIFPLCLHPASHSPLLLCIGEGHVHTLCHFWCHPLSTQLLGSLKHEVPSGDVVIHAAPLQHIDIDSSKIQHVVKASLRLWITVRWPVRYWVYPRYISQPWDLPSITLAHPADCIQSLQCLFGINHYCIHYRFLIYITDQSDNPHLKKIA